MLAKALLLLLWGCGHRSPRAAAPAEAPVLPAPVAPWYATGPSEPRDPLVARLVAAGELPWEESLAGAATGLVLDTAHLDTLEESWWRAICSGYPYPVVHLVAGEAEPGELPADLLATLRQVLRPGDQVGIVRARRDLMDHWLALVGRPRGQVDPFPRELGRGDTVNLAARVPATFALVSPTGVLSRGPLPADPVLAEEGEWWVEVRRADGAVLVSLPLFVGVSTPDEPLLDLPGDEVDSPAEVARLAGVLLAVIRAEYEGPPLEADRVLATLAERPLEQWLDGTWERAQGESRLRGAGFVGGPVAQLACRARTVATCLDGLLRDPDSRAALLDPRMRVVGLAPYLDTQGMALVLNLASE